MLKITIEGGQGEGKSTAARIISTALLKAGYAVKHDQMKFSGQFVVASDAFKESLPAIEIVEQQT